MPGIRETLMRERALARHKSRAQRSEEMRSLENSLIMAIQIGGGTVTTETNWSSAYNGFNYTFAGRNVTDIVRRMRKKKQIDEEHWEQLHRVFWGSATGRMTLRKLGKSAALGMQYGTMLVKQHMQARLVREKVEPSLATRT